MQPASMNNKEGWHDATQCTASTQQSFSTDRVPPEERARCKARRYCSAATATAPPQEVGAARAGRAAAPKHGTPPGREAKDHQVVMSMAAARTADRQLRRENGACSQIAHKTRKGSRSVQVYPSLAAQRRACRTGSGDNHTHHCIHHSHTCIRGSTRHSITAAQERRHGASAAPAVAARPHRRHKQRRRNSTRRRSKSKMR